MSDTPSKKNSIFDKALLGTAGILAIGMMALGPRGEDNPSLDNEKLAENQGVGKEEGQKAPAGMKEGKSGANNEVAALQAELNRARLDNATLKAQLRKKEIALEMRKEKESGDPNVQALKKVKTVLEAKEAELAKLKSKLASVGKGPSVASTGKAVDDAREQKEQLIKNLEKLLKEAKSGN